MRQRIQVGVYAMGRNRVEELSGANGVGDVRKTGRAIEDTVSSITEMSRQDPSTLGKETLVE